MFSLELNCSLHTDAPFYGVDAREHGSTVTEWPRDRCGARGHNRTEETATGFTEFLAETARGIESENKQLINLNPDFPPERG